MGNVLCVPRRPKNSTRKNKKKRGKRRWSSRKNRTQTDTDIGQDASTHSEQTKEDIPTKDEEEQSPSSTTTRVSQSNLFYVDPVVSNSILLKHFDDENEAKETENQARTTDEDDKDRFGVREEDNNRQEVGDETQFVGPGFEDVEASSYDEKPSHVETQRADPSSKEAETTSNEVEHCAVEARLTEPGYKNAKAIHIKEKPKAQPVEPIPKYSMAAYKEEKPEIQPAEARSKDVKAASKNEKPEPHSVEASYKEKPETQHVELSSKDANAASNEEKPETQPVEPNSKDVMVTSNQEKSNPTKEQSKDSPADEKHASESRDVKSKLIVVKPAPLSNGLGVQSKPREIIHIEEAKGTNTPYDTRATKDKNMGPSTNQIDSNPAFYGNLVSGVTTSDSNTAPHLKAASSFPAVPHQSKVASDGMKELAKILEALSALKAPLKINSRTPSKSNAGFSRNVWSTQAGTTTSLRVTNTQQSGQAGGTVTPPQAKIPADGFRTKFNKLVRLNENVVSPQPGTSRYPGVIDKSQQSNEIHEHTNLQTLEADKASRKELATQHTSKDLVNTLVLPDSDTNGVYKSAERIQKWLKSSASEPLPKVTVDGLMPNDKGVPRRVSDFQIPKKKPRPPPKPLALKKPRPHLFGLPGIVKSDLTEDDSVTWLQKDLKGPQTEVLWSSKPTSYDVKFPPLPKRLLEREGSIDKLRDSWVIPQARQIETLKREYGRFPGMRVPKKLRNKYSVDVESPDIDNGDESTDNDNNNDDDDDDFNL